MPNINGKQYPYTPAGRRAAKRNARKVGSPMQPGYRQAPSPRPQQAGMPGAFGQRRRRPMGQRPMAGSMNQPMPGGMRRNMPRPGARPMAPLSRRQGGRPMSNPMASRRMSGRPGRPGVRNPGLRNPAIDSRPVKPTPPWGDDGWESEIDDYS